MTREVIVAIKLFLITKICCLQIIVLVVYVCVCSVIILICNYLEQHNKGSEFSKKEVDLIIMAMFEEELLSFQRKIFQHGISKYFIPAGTINNLISIFINLLHISIFHFCLLFYNCLLNIWLWSINAISKLQLLIIILPRKRRKFLGIEYIGQTRNKQCGRVGSRSQPLILEFGCPKF